MKIRADFPDFRTTRTAINDVFANLPTWAGNAALNFFLDSWRRQGFIDKTFKRWLPRRFDTRPGGAVLIGKGSGQLRRSLRLRTGPDFFEVYTSSPYAKLHNEGGHIRQTVTPRQRRYFWARYHEALTRHKSPTEAAMWKRMALSRTLTINVPKRQFMGDSQLLRRRVLLHVQRALDHAIK